MPIALPPRQAGANTARESFLFKSMLVASALFIGTLLVVMPSSIFRHQPSR